MYKLQVVLLVAVFSLVTALPAFGEAPSGDGATIKYQVYNSTAEILMRIADQRFCEKYELQCEPVFIPSSSQGLQSMLGGSLDVAYLGTDFGIRAASNGSGIKIMSGASDRVNLQLVRRSDVDWPNKDLGYPEMMKDFKGKTVGVSGRGASTEIVFNLMMRDSGYGEDKLTIVGVGGPSTALGALRSKRVEAVMLFQPLPAICDHSDVCETAIDLTKPERPEVMAQFDGAATTIWASGSALEEKEKAFKAWGAALRDAAEWLVKPENYDEALEIVNGYININLPNASAIVEDGLKEQIDNTNTTLNKQSVTAYIELLKRRELLGDTAVNADKLVWDHAPVEGD